MENNLKKTIENQLTLEQYKSTIKVNPLPEFNLLVDAVYIKLKKMLPVNYSHLTIELSDYEPYIRIDGKFSSENRQFSYYACFSLSEKTQKFKAVRNYSDTMDITPPPVKSIDAFIKEIKAITLEDFERTGDFLMVISQISQGVDAKNPDFKKAIPVILDLFERFPNHDFGAPGPLVHMIEEYGNYGNELVASIKRMPATMAFVLLHRLMQSKLSVAEQKLYTEAYLSILINPKTSKQLIELLEDWVNELIDEDIIIQELFEEYQAKKTTPKVKSIETFVDELNKVTERYPKKLTGILKSISENVKRDDADFQKAIPVIFGLFERYAEYSNLGPLQGMLRTSKLYIPELKKSLQRKPSFEAVSMMINVFWEEKISDKERKECSEIYKAILTHPNTPIEVLEKTKKYMDAMMKKGLLI